MWERKNSRPKKLAPISGSNFTLGSVQRWDLLNSFQLWFTKALPVSFNVYSQSKPQGLPVTTRSKPNGVLKPDRLREGRGKRRDAYLLLVLGVETCLELCHGGKCTRGSSTTMCALTVSTRQAPWMVGSATFSFLRPYHEVPVAQAPSPHTSTTYPEIQETSISQAQSWEQPVPLTRLCLHYQTHNRLGRQTGKRTSLNLIFLEGVFRPDTSASALRYYKPQKGVRSRHALNAGSAGFIYLATPNSGSLICL